jgi:hypothetical protein
MDKDLKILEDAASSVMTIDRRYRLASFNDKIAMKSKRDQAFRAYVKARINLLQDGVVATQADVNEMIAIKEAVSKARSTQSTIEGAISLATFLVKFA